MRFNAPEHLELWKRAGDFPAIHRAIFAAIKAFDREKRGLDLCCSTGLLGQQLHEAGWNEIVGVDGDKKALESAKAAGIKIGLCCLRIVPEAIDTLADLISKRAISSLYARRCFPELFGNDREFGIRLLGAAKSAGIRQLFLQGRVVTPKATNSLRSIREEVELARAAGFEPLSVDGQIAVMESR